MDTGIEIKQEDCFSDDLASQNERELFHKVITLKSNSIAVVPYDNCCDMAIKTEIKPETSFPEFEAVTCRNNCEVVTKTNIEDQILDSDFNSQKETEVPSEDPLMGNNCNSDQEMVNKIEIKVEPWWLETETSSVCGDIKDEDFSPVTSSSSYQDGVPSSSSDLFSSEYLGNDACFNMNKNSSESGIGIKYRKQKNVTGVFSMETSVGSETSNAGNIISMVSSSTQSKFLQHSNITKQANCKSISSHEYRKPYTCEVSAKCSKYSTHLEKHGLILDTNEVNKCDVQDKGFNQLSSLKVQNLIHVTHKCNICDSTLSTLSDLKTHKLIHEGVKPHKCNMCNKDFGQLSTLKRHKLIHDGIKPHKCNNCNKAFTRLSALKTHKLIHEGVKAHKCNICNNAFTTLSYLKKHKLIHQGIKPYKCNICNKAFNHLFNFKTHKLIHEGIKPHKCNICNKAFTDLSNFKTHKSIHQDVKPHKCNICDRAFNHLSSLKRHKRLHRDQ